MTNDVHRLHHPNHPRLRAATAAAAGPLGVGLGLGLPVRVLGLLRLGGMDLVVAVNAVPIDVAASELGVSASTLKRWLRRGAPIAERGRRGRGCRALIDVQAVRAWQARRGPTDDAGQLLADLRREAPEMAVEAALSAIAALSPVTTTGAEHRLLRAAVGDAGRRFAEALASWAENRSQDEPF